MEEQRNDFSQGSVAKNIMSMAIPMTIAQLMNVLYSLVDRMYIGHIPGTGRIVLTGMGLTLPIISVIMAFANLCGMGGSPLCSIHRGRGDLEEAGRVMGNSFLLLLCFGVAIPLVLLPVCRPMLYLFGASDATYPHASAYITLYLLGTPFVMIGLGMNPFINSQGFGRKGMLTVTLGAVVNLVLDPIFIFGLDMGVRGAALATVLSQACSAAWVLRFLTGPQAILRLRITYMRPKAARMRKIIALGLSGFFTSLTNSLVQVVCNKVLYIYGGDPYVGIMTVINSIREVAFMITHGLTNGSQPVLGYNYGAGRYDRVRAGIRFSSLVTVAYACLVWLVTMAFPGLLIRLFNDEPELLVDGIPAMRIYFCMFVFMALMISGQAVFVALGQSKKAVFFSLLRKAVINAPLTVILAMCWGTTGVFAAEAISQFVVGSACFLTMYFTVYRPLGDPSRLHPRV